MEDWRSLFLDLLKANYGRWRMIARSYAGAESEDLLQEILLQIWKSLPSYCGESAPGSWCYRVALNTAQSWRRADQARRNRLPVVGTAVGLFTLLAVAMGIWIVRLNRRTAAARFQPLRDDLARLHDSL